MNINRNAYSANRTSRTNTHNSRDESIGDGEDFNYVYGLIDS